MFGAEAPPVEVFEIARYLGFTVLEYPFPESTSGLTYIEGEIKTIGVNSFHAQTRKRFSVAHELGHYLNGHESYEGGAVGIDDRPSYLNPYNRQEQEANEFAAELLMPTDWIKADVAEMGISELDAVKLARRYGVSEQAMWIQLLDLGIV